MKVSYRIHLYNLFYLHRVQHLSKIKHGTNDKGEFNHALNEQLREANKVNESQYGKAKAFIENAYNEMIRPHSATMLHG